MKKKNKLDLSSLFHFQSEKFSHFLTQNNNSFLFQKLYPLKFLHKMHFTKIKQKQHTKKLHHHKSFRRLTQINFKVVFSY